METFFSRYKNPLVLGFVLIAQFFLLAVQVRRPFPAATARVDQEGVRALRFGVTSVVTPPESVLHQSGLSLRDVWSSYLDLVGVRAENAKLKEEVDQLHMEQAALAEDARQGERLQDLLAFRQHYINTTVPAQVVGTSGTDRSRVLYLDKGSDDGIAADQPVITPDGIVGRVREVYPHTAQVVEISDPTSAAGVLLEDTRTRGILRGNTQGQPQIVNLMPDDRIKPGQLVLTSGGDQIFPRGLPVGVVDHISPDKDNEPMVDVVLKPAANLGRLEEVLVVTGTGAAPTERARQDLSKSELMAAGARAAKEAKAQQETDDSQRASDVLAQRLPSRYDQADFYAPDATADASPATSEAEAKPLHPPAPLHPDHYSPADVPAAQSLTPGQRYAPLVEGSAATERRTAQSGGDNVNATDNAPVVTNPAFASAAAAVAAQRKAIADAKAATAARQYAAAHPDAPAPKAATEPTAVSAIAAGGASSAAVVHYTSHVGPDGTVTRSTVPASTPLFTRQMDEDGKVTWVPAGAATAQYVTKSNADGSVTKVPERATPLYMARINADGSTTHLPVLTSTAPVAAVHYVNRTNPDGSTTRVAVPGPAPSAGATGALRYTERLNADGTIARVALPAGSSAPAVHYVTRTNPDGTTTRIAVPEPARTAGGATAEAKPVVRSRERTNADGTLTRIPVPSATVPSTAGAATSSRPSAAPGSGVQTRVIADGPLPAGSHSATAAPRRPPSAASQTPGTASPAAKRRGPEIVPGDGSKPPARSTAPVAPQGNL